MTRNTDRAIVGLIATAALCIAIAPATVADDLTPAAPGLPFVYCDSTLTSRSPDSCGRSPIDNRNTFGWQNTIQIGMAGSVPSKQWARLPLTMLATNADFVNEPEAIGKVDNVGTIESQQVIGASAFFVSPQSSSRPYGNSAVIPVRTLAFGSIPAQIDLQINQERRTDGTPKGFELRARNNVYVLDDPEAPAQTYSSTVDPIRANVTVSVKRLKVDSEDIELSGPCATDDFARLNLSSKFFVSDPTDPAFPDNQFDADQYFYGASGGSLFGNIEIPAFSDCETTSGDDVSRLITAAVSGSTNPVTIKISPLACILFNDDFTRYLPSPAGVNSPADPRAGCPRVDYANPTVETLPNLVPYPSFAPGSAPKE